MAAKLAFETGIRTCVVYGGSPMREQLMELEQGCDILVATPGRLTDMLERGKVSLALVHFLVLDEADRLLDMGLEPQVRQIVQHMSMSESSGQRRQSMMCSATFGREVQLLARDLLRDHLFVATKKGQGGPPGIHRLLHAEGVAQKVQCLEQAIKDYLPADGLAVVSVNTKRGADQLELDLREKGVHVVVVQGDRTAKEREAALDAFRSGASPVLVATDVAARGLTVPNVAMVASFDMPRDLDDYLHRIGRLRPQGVAVALVDEHCPYLGALRQLVAETGDRVSDLRELEGDASAVARPRATS